MSINIRLTAPIVPEGVKINASLSLNRITADLAELKKALMFVHDEADINRTATPGERTLTAKFNALERSIIAGLPPEVRLNIANKAGGLA